MPETGTFDVFLSHNSEDKVVVRRIATALKNRGLHVWLDEWELQPGGLWIPALEEAIETSQSAAILVGKHGLGPWEQPEYEAALLEFIGRGIPVIPVWLPELSQKPKLPLFLRRFTWVDLHKGITRHGLNLLEWGIRGKKPTRTTRSGRQESTQGGAAPRLHNLPVSLGDLFEGRDADLARLSAGLAVAGNRAAVLYGLGGVGKTRLAVEFGWRHGGSYEAVFFASARSGERLRAQIASLEKLVGPPDREARSEEMAYESVLRWLREHPGWLLILDGVETREEAKKVVADHLPLLSSGQVLITSQLNEWEPVVSLQEVTPIALEDASRFLLRRTGPAQSVDNVDEEAMRLATILGGLPLALEQAASYIRRNRITLRQYRQDWEQETRLDEDASLYERSLAGAFQQTVGQLGPTAEVLLRLIAFFAPEPIPAGLLAGDSELVSQGEVGLSAESERAYVGSSPSRRALADLAGYSMIRWENQWIFVNRVVQEVTRHWIPEGRRAFWAKLALRLVDSFSPDPNDESCWPLWERLRPHAAQVIDYARSYGLGGDAFRLMNQLATYLGARAIQSQEAERLMKEALVKGQTSLGDVPAVATAMNNLAQLLKGSSPGEAESLARKALAIDRAAAGPQNPNTARDLDTLAGLVHGRGDLAQAESLLREALAIDVGVFGENHRDVARDLNNLANVLEQAGRLGEAKDLMQRVLAIDEAIRDQSSTHATHLTNFARLEMDTTGDLKVAEPLLQRALEIDQLAFGKDHPLVARDHGNLAELLQRDGRWKDAEIRWRRALEIDESASDPHHQDVAYDLNNLASVLVAQRRLGEAVDCLQRARDIFAVSPDPGPQTAQRLDMDLARLRKEAAEQAAGKRPAARRQAPAPKKKPNRRPRRQAAGLAQ